MIGITDKTVFGNDTVRLAVAFNSKTGMIENNSGKYPHNINTKQFALSDYFGAYIEASLDQINKKIKFTFNGHS